MKKFFIYYLARYPVGYPESRKIISRISGGRISGHISIRYNPTLYNPDFKIITKGGYAHDELDIGSEVGPVPEVAGVEVGEDSLPPPLCNQHVLGRGFINQCFGSGSVSFRTPGSG